MAEGGIEPPLAHYEWDVNLPAFGRFVFFLYLASHSSGPDVYPSCDSVDSVPEVSALFCRQVSFQTLLCHSLLCHSLLSEPIVVKLERQNTRVV